MKFEDIEKAQKEYSEKFRKFGWYLLAICAAALIMAIFLIVRGGSWLFSIPMVLFWLVFGFVIGLVVISFATRNERAAYRKAYKAYFVERVLAETFTNLKYNHAAGLPQEILISTGMVNTGDVYSSNDLTVARYKNVEFMQADVHIQERHEDSEGHTSYVTLFKGRFMIFDFPKKFDFSMELVGSRIRVAKVPRSSKPGRKFKPMKTESVEFNRHFKIYAEDGFEMFYILDPAFMEKIQKVSETYEGKVMFGFIGNRLLVGINNGKDSFEPPRFSKPIDEKAELEKNRADIKVITDFVDQLKLDRKLFKK